jgi:MFS family permease
MSAIQNRWVIAFAGIVVMLCVGTVYSWSIFTNVFVAGFKWSTQETTLAFELAIFFLGLGAFFGGRWQDRVGPRTVTIVGVILWGAGVMFAGLGTFGLGKIWLYATYGVLGAFGGGMAYVTPVTMVTKWFPDRRGLGSGMVVMGFGLGAFVYNQIVSRLGIYKAAAKPAGAYVKAKAEALKGGTLFDPSQYALTADQVHGVLTIFTISGLVFIIVGGLAALVLRNPDTAAAPASASGATIANASFTLGEALRMPQLYGLWLLLFLNVTAGILIISNAAPIYSELTGAAPAVAAQIYGGLAIFNALGRFFWGTVSDRIGRNLTYTIMYLIQALAFFFMAKVGGGLVGVGILIAIVLLCYGGGFGVMPSFNADYFGTKYMGEIYGFILTAWGVAGLVGPFIAARVKDATGSYAGALIPVAVMLLIASVIPFFVKKPPARPAESV